MTDKNENRRAAERWRKAAWEWFDTTTHWESSTRFRHDGDRLILLDSAFSPNYPRPAEFYRGVTGTPQPKLTAAMSNLAKASDDLAVKVEGAGIDATSLLEFASSFPGGRPEQLRFVTREQWLGYQKAELLVTRFEARNGSPADRDRVSFKDALAGREDLGLAATAETTLRRWIKHEVHSHDLGVDRKGTASLQEPLVAALKKLQEKVAHKKQPRPRGTE